MTGARYAEILRGAEAIAECAAETLSAMRGRALAVNRKELRDVVTEADLASERIVLGGIRALTPNATIISEEAGSSGGEGGTRWFVDPLDGTVNYAAGLPWFSVTMAYQEDARTRVGVVHAPGVDLLARYAEGGIATVNGRDAQVSARRSLSDAVVSIVLTSHFTEREVARTAEAVRRLGNTARGVRTLSNSFGSCSLVFIRGS